MLFILGAGLIVAALASLVLRRLPARASEERGLGSMSERWLAEQRADHSS
jgi:hypothetical protein